MKSPHRIARLPRVLWLLGLIDDPADKAEARRKASTFFRRYRRNPLFPEPLDLPDGQLGYWEHEVIEFLESRPRTDDPRKRVAPCLSHWERLERQAGVRSAFTSPSEAA